MSVATLVVAAAMPGGSDEEGGRKAVGFELTLKTRRN